MNMYQYLERMESIENKQMKRGYSKYCTIKEKDETIISLIKRLFGEQITSSRLVRIQNKELSLRCIAYNMHRLTNLVIIAMFSTYPFIWL